jgi:hypothetical protein
MIMNKHIKDEAPETQNISERHLVDLPANNKLMATKGGGI